MPPDIIAPAPDWVLVVDNEANQWPSAPAPAPAKKVKPKWDGWVELKLTDIPKKGDVICLDGVNPEFYGKYHAMSSFIRGTQSGYYIHSGLVGEWPTYACAELYSKRKKGRIWRKKPQMNPFYSKPLPLP